jgi:hypothetical protein
MNKKQNPGFSKGPHRGCDPVGRCGAAAARIANGLRVQTLYGARSPGRPGPLAGSSDAAEMANDFKYSRSGAHPWPAP